MLDNIKNYEDNLKFLKTHDVVIGIPKKNNAQHEASTNADIGFKHEFGVGVPQRSFLKISLLKDRDKIVKSTQKFLTKNPKKTLELIGVHGQNSVLESFKTEGFGKWKALSERTKEHKKSDKILIDTGQLRQSITFEVRKNVT